MNPELGVRLDEFDEILGIHIVNGVLVTIAIADVFSNAQAPRTVDAVECLHPGRSTPWGGHNLDGRINRYDFLKHRHNILHVSGSIRSPWLPCSYGEVFQSGVSGNTIRQIVIGVVFLAGEVACAYRHTHGGEATLLGVEHLRKNRVTLFASH